MPERVQLKRSKGWRMPPNTVKVDRSTAYGNLFVAGKPINEMLAHDYGADTPSWFGLPAGRIVRDAAEAVELYERWIVDCKERGVPLCLPALRGKNLACWCPIGSPCHADVLLKAANQ